MSQLVAAGEDKASPETRLVQRAVRGERGAFGRLFERYVDAVFNYLYFRVRDSALAEDLAQDVFVSAYRAIGGLRDPRRFELWLMRIAHNRVLNHWRERSARPRLEERGAAADGRLPEMAGSDPRGAMDGLETRLSAEEVLAATAALTDLQQQVVALRFVSGLSVVETAAVMGRSENAVKNLQHHALAALRRHLAIAEVER